MSKEDILITIKKYDSSIAYPTILQELIQRRTKDLPVYKITIAQPARKHGADDSVEVGLSWGDYKIIARGPNKIIGKNLCAFQLLEKLVEDNDFWMVNNKI